MNGGKVASGVFIIILGLVLFVGIPLGGGFEYTLVFPPLVLIFLLLGLYRIVRGMTESPMEKLTGAQSRMLDEILDPFSETVAGFVQEKYSETTNRSESEEFSRAVLMYVRVHGLPDFLNRSPDELRALFARESGWGREERRRVIDEWTREALERFWQRWKSQRNASA